MVTYLLKKSYQRKTLKEINFKDFNLSKRETEIQFEKIEKWLLKELAEVYLKDNLKVIFSSKR